MKESDNHLSRIECQFTRQGDAYSRLAYVTAAPGLKKVVALGETQESDTVLDIACGPGFLTLAFAEVCKEVVGVDITESFLVKARQEAETRNITNAQFVSGNVEELQFDDNSFDLVVCRAAFHHFPRPENVLAEIKRVAKPQGKVLVLDMLASEDPLKAGYRNRMERLCDPTHVKALSESEFQALFTSSGLQLLSTRKSKTTYSLSEWIEHGGLRLKTSPKFAK